MIDYKKMQTHDVMRRAVEGDTEALSELIERQQLGAAYRLYPYGRDGPDDEGVCPIMLLVNDDNIVEIKSGRPNETLLFGREQLEDWVIGMAELFAYSINQYSKRGLSEGAVEIAIDSQSDDDFECSVIPDKKLGRALIEFSPVSRTSWKIPLRGACSFIRQSLVAAEKMGWKMEASESELAALRPFIDLDE